MSTDQLISVQLAARNYGYELRLRPTRVARGYYEIVQKGLVVFSAQTLVEVQTWLQDQ